MEPDADVPDRLGRRHGGDLYLSDQWSLNSGQLARLIRAWRTRTFAHYQRIGHVDFQLQNPRFGDDCRCGGRSEREAGGDGRVPDWRS